MALERAGGSELAELAAYHVLGHVHGNMLAAVVYGDGVTYHLGELVVALDHVLTTFFSPAAFIASILDRRRGSA